MQIDSLCGQRVSIIIADRCRFIAGRTAVSSLLAPRSAPGGAYACTSLRGTSPINISQVCALIAPPPKKSWERGSARSVERGTVTRENSNRERGEGKKKTRWKISAIGIVSSRFASIDEPIFSVLLEHLVLCLDSLRISFLKYEIKN